MTEQSADIRWFDDILVLDAATPVGEVRRLVAASVRQWIVLSRSGGMYLYAFRGGELLSLLTRRVAAGMSLAMPTEQALRLREEDSSTQVTNREAPGPIETGWRRGISGPSVQRYVHVGPQGPVAVGIPVPPVARGSDVAAAPAVRPLPDYEHPASPPRPFSANTPPPWPLELVPVPSEQDDGANPVRYPSIEAKGLFSAGSIEIVVDLGRERAAHTAGAPIAPKNLPEDWQALPVTVIVSADGIDFEKDGTAVVTIRRNQESIPARIRGTFRAPPSTLKPVLIQAAFFDGTRFCGQAAREVTVGQNPALAPETRGGVRIESTAQRPDLTVYISADGEPDQLMWQLVTVRFDGLPPRLSEKMSLGTLPAQEATELFKTLATLERGTHVPVFEGVGSRLWSLAPETFRRTYWALCDRHQRPLTIQFITDEPHVPWELMRPSRGEPREAHEPLAFRHAVGRWIKRWDGYMRSVLPGGDVLTIAPRYRRPGQALDRAQDESAAVVKKFAARRVDGTMSAVKALFESTPSPPVALLHFAGHGNFSPQAAAASRISLEDGALLAVELERAEVRLGEACRTLVFFNACEVGAAAGVFGEIGGWADSFLGKQFGGFIAPLWPVDDEDASNVSLELIDGVVKKGQSVGEALRELRSKHGSVSPTFYSYLYYGDVLARFDGPTAARRDGAHES